ncbi:methyl-accepting chemotaxis protein [Vreelandella azerica]|nr:methyl-accepting chemotaxis protein [Halomonas azerica]
MLLEDKDVSGFLSGESRVDTSSRQFVASVDAFLNSVQANGHALQAQFESISRWLFQGVIAALTIALLMIVIVVWGVVKNVIRPLNEVTRHFKRIANGDLSAPITARNRNEIGELFHELGQMQEALTATVTRLNHSSERVHVSSQEMTTHNDSLSARTEEQMNALQRMANSLDKLKLTVGQNVDKAEHINQMTTATTQKAQSGEQVVSEFVATMASINKDSEAIQSIIDLIDSIAFQTNILALNASVEAARAGEHGKGFAVVANEVRHLASRSANAASDIRQRLEASRKSVLKGNALSQQAGEHTRGIITAVKEVDQLMDDVIQAYAAQRIDIESLEANVISVEQSAQETRQTVYEASACARHLEGESNDMHEYAHQFTLNADTPSSQTLLSKPSPDAYESAEVATVLNIFRPRWRQSRPALPATTEAATGRP